MLEQFQEVAKRSGQVTNAKGLSFSFLLGGARGIEPALRDNEDVPLTAETARGADVNQENEAYFKREGALHVKDAWIDASKKDERDQGAGVVGYEIPFNRHFYRYEPPRTLQEIDADSDVLSRDIMEMLREVHA